MLRINSGEESALGCGAGVKSRSFAIAQDDTAGQLNGRINLRASLETPPILGGRLDKISIRVFIVVEAQQSQSEEPHG
jgi:hypothetical protein